MNRTAGTVLYIHANNDEVGGADYCLAKMAHEVELRGWRAVVLLRRRTPIAAIYSRLGISVVYGDLPRLRKTRNPLQLAAYVVDLFRGFLLVRRTIREHRANLVHTNDLLDFVGNAAASSMHVPSFQHVRMIVRRPALLRRALAWLVQRSGGTVLCVSDGVRTAMFGEAEGVKVLYDWVDMAAVGHTETGGFAPLRELLGIPAGAIIVGSVGRLEEWKGQHLFLEMAARVAVGRPDVHFVIIGGTTTGKEAYASDLAARRERSPARQQVHLLGHRSDIGSLMKQLDVLVHSSVEPDPFPGVVLEGLTTGPTVVAARAGGVPEQVRDGETGFLYEPADVGAMADAVARALAVADRGAMAARARADVLHRFSKAPIVDQLVAAYSSRLADTA